MSSPFGSTTYARATPDKNRGTDVPTNNAAHRPPLPEQKNQQQARQQDIRAPLRCVRNSLRQSLLEPLPRHEAVLDREDSKQGGIDDLLLQAELAVAFDTKDYAGMVKARLAGSSVQML